MEKLSRQLSTLSRWKSLTMFFGALFLVLSMGFVYSGMAQWPFEFIRVGEANVNIYVVCLDGVNAHSVGNTSLLVDGVYGAASIPAHSSEQPEKNIIWFRSGFGSEPAFTFYGVKVNVTVTTIAGWSQYREVIEEGANGIVVNAHGETLPVPADYTKEEWIDRIATAMTERNMTWVHTTWYPFYYYQPQDGLEEEWGSDGFKRLMTHIGKDNVTCWPSDPETEPMSLTAYAENTLKEEWNFESMRKVQLGRPLKASDFDDHTVLPIWGYSEEHLTGAVVKFAEAYNTTLTFGFYVHIGTNQTFDGDNRPVPNSDKWRGYAGAAAAIWTVSVKKVAENRLLDAKHAITEAQDEGKTKGLDQALDLLQKAEGFLTGENNYTTHHSYDSTIVLATLAKEAAEKATTPSFTEAYGLPIILIVATTAAAASIGAVMMHRKNSRVAFLEGTSFLRLT